MDQQIRFCTTSDGVRIAYAVVGEGPVRVWVPGWISHLEQSWASPDSRADLEHWAQDHTIVRFDKRGTGLSQRDLGDYTIETRLRDLEAVIEDLKLKRFSLSGTSEGGPLAIAYAAKHPRRVSHLLLFGTFASNPFRGREAAVDALSKLIEAEWGFGSRTIANVFYPDASPEQLKEYARYERESASGKDAALMVRGMANIDVTAMLPRITAKTLVIHGKRDMVVPFERGVELAAGIKNARLVAHDGPHYTMSIDADAHDLVTRAIHEFLGEESTTVRSPGHPGVGTGGGAVTVLFTDIAGSTDLTQRLGDGAAQELVRRHNTAVRSAIVAGNGREIKHTGDGIMASFGSPSAAVECAIAIQRTLDAESDGALRVRIGLNAGEPIAEDGDLFGTAVQLAARICDRATAGQILVSSVVRELCAGKGFSFTDRGEASLKGFAEAVRLHAVEWRATA